MRLAALMSVAAVWAGVSAVCGAEAGRTQTSGLPRATPASQGIPAAAVCDFLDRLTAEDFGLRAFMLLRHGCVVAEGYWAPFAKDVPLTLNEASGGVVAMAVALAVQEGRLTLDDHVGWVLPKSVPQTADERQRDLRVRDLLSMSSGADDDAFDAMRSGDPVKAFLAMPMAAVPGRNFRYFRANDAMLAQLLTKVTQERNLRVYLNERLFAPLGIQGDSDVWRGFANGTVFGSGGLSLRAEDFARLAQLLLQGGRWNGKQVLPEWFVPQAITCQTPYGKILDPVVRHQTGMDGFFRSAPGSDEWRCGYGFGLWLGSDGSYRMSGAYGQLAAVWPQHDLVFVSFAAADGANGKILATVRETLLPKLSATALQAEPTAEKTLVTRCERLRLAQPKGRAKPTPEALARAAAGCVFPENDLGIKRLKYEETKGLLKFENAFDIQELPVKSDGSWSLGAIQLESVRASGDPLYSVPGGEIPAVACGAWTSPTRFEVRVVFQCASLTLDFTLDCAHEPMAFTCKAAPMWRYFYPAVK